MESNDIIDCAIRVKEEPSDAPLIGNDCGMINEKADLKNFQLLPFFRKNSTHIPRKCEGYSENELADEAKIVFECEDMKPNNSSLAVKKTDDDSQNHLRTDTDDYQTQSLIIIEPVGKVKQEYFNDAAEESNLNVNDQLVEKNKKRRVQENLNHKNGLKTHTGSDHNETTHQCEVCGKKFSTKSNLKMHISTLHKGVKHACDICGKKFAQKSQLKVHIDAVHKGVRHACDVCEKKFSNKSNLKNHISTFHKGVKHACNICGKTFSQKGSLKVHIDSAHHDVAHACDICAKKCSTKSNLKTHIDRKHNGVTYSCDICGKKYSKKSYLKLHIDAMHNGVICKCDLCEKKCSTKSHLKTHINAMHNCAPKINVIT